MRRLLAGLLVMTAVTACGADGSEEPNVTITVQEATEVLTGYLEEILSPLPVREKPFRHDSGPIPCDDPPFDEPDRAKANVFYEVFLDAKDSYGTAESIKEDLVGDGWVLNVNEGAPETQLMFAGSKDGYILNVSGTMKNPRLVVGGTTVCAMNPET